MSITPTKLFSSPERFAASVASMRSNSPAAVHQWSSMTLADRCMVTVPTQASPMRWSTSSPAPGAPASK